MAKRQTFFTVTPELLDRVNPAIRDSLARLTKFNPAKIMGKTISEADIRSALHLKPDQPLPISPGPQVYRPPALGAPTPPSTGGGNLPPLVPTGPSTPGTPTPPASPAPGNPGMAGAPAWWLGINAAQPWWRGQWYRPGTTQPAEYSDWYQQLVYNALIPNLDPITQGTTAAWLARDNPAMFGQYENVPGVAGQNPVSQDVAQQYLDPARLNALAQAVDYNSIKGRLNPELQGILGELERTNKDDEIQQLKDITAASRWLSEALRTAAAGVGGTRRQQQTSQEHIQTLMREAETEPERAGRFKTLFENITNPVSARSGLEQRIGAGRALDRTSDEYMRAGFARRNPWAT